VVVNRTVYIFIKIVFCVALADVLCMQVLVAILFCAVVMFLIFS